MVVARLSGQPLTPRFLHAAVGDLQRIGHIGVSLFHDPGLQWRAAPGWCREMANTPLRPAFKQSPCQCGGCHPAARQAADAGIDAGKTFTLRKRFPPCAQALRPPCPANGGKSGSTRLVRRLPGSDAPILQNATMPYDSPRDLPDNVGNVLPRTRRTFICPPATTPGTPTPTPTTAVAMIRVMKWRTRWPGRRCSSAIQSRPMAAGAPGIDPRLRLPSVPASSHDRAAPGMAWNLHFPAA